MKKSLIAFGCLLSSVAASPAFSATSCGDLSALHLADVTITKAETITSLVAVSNSMAQAPAPSPFCRVVGFITPTADSHIAFEVWLPRAEDWNSKFQAVGNGGFLGVINYRAVLPALKRNYAAMTNDLGHTNVNGASEDATWALNHPEKVIDYAYRGEHLSVVAAKQIITAFYGKPAEHSYYTGCSAGGIQGLTELLRYPTDFDGYVIGNAVPDHLAQELGALWNTLEASLKYPSAAIRPEQIPFLHSAVLSQCAGKDGGLASDPFLTDPRLCKFDPATIQCKRGQQASACLSPAQVGIVQRIYRGPVNPRTGTSLFAGITPGAELTWDRFFTGKKNPATADRPWGGFLMYMAYSDPEYLSQQKYLTFDFDKDVTALRKRMVGGETLDSSWNSRNRDLEAFRKAGGKVIQYHGWDDPNIPALEAIKMFDSVAQDQAKRHRVTQAEASAAIQQFYRLFMVQGLGHCTGGDGAWSFGQNGQAPRGAGPQYDTLKALEAWVEKGIAPEQFIGSRVDTKTNAVDMTRPICVYPKIPVWNGSGSTAEAMNFHCSSPSAPQKRTDVTTGQDIRNEG